MQRAIGAEVGLRLAWSVAVARLLRDPTVVARGVQQLHQDVQVSVDRARLADRALAVPIRWVATAGERFVPSFDGTLELLSRTDDDDEDELTALRLVGTYSIPLDDPEPFAVGLRGRQIAHETVRGLLVDVASRLHRAGMRDAS